MAYKPSTRMKEEEGELNLNLNPMMDMFAVLIPALLMMSVVVEVAVVNVSAPAISNDDTAQKAPDKPPLNLTVTITEAGYLVTTAQGPLAGGDGAVDAKQPTIPIVERTILCSRYRGTRPPPRTRNHDRLPCAEDKPYDKRSFWVYDVEALARKVMEIKDQNPDERRIIIGGSREVEYESLVDVMDAARDVIDKRGEVRPLFDEVVLSPGL